MTYIKLSITITSWNDKTRCTRKILLKSISHFKGFELYAMQERKALPHLKSLFHSKFVTPQAQIQLTTAMSFPKFLTSCQRTLNITDRRRYLHNPSWQDSRPHFSKALSHTQSKHVEEEDATCETKKSTVFHV